jgi:hypothetical protein
MLAHATVNHLSLDARRFGAGSVVGVIGSRFVWVTHAARGQRWDSNGGRGWNVVPRLSHPVRQPDGPVSVLIWRVTCPAGAGNGG